MTELDDFVTQTVKRHIDAGDVMHNGDATPLIETLSETDPVTLFPALAPAKSGWDEVSRNFRWVASRFSNGTPLTFDVVAAGVSGDLAYLVGYERCSVSIDSGPVQPSNLRVTHVYRREEGEWKLVHRHGSYEPSTQSPAKEDSTL
jgi:ketosteroid isomerase-like protein